MTEVGTSTPASVHMLGQHSQRTALSTGTACSALVRHPKVRMLKRTVSRLPTRPHGAPQDCTTHTTIANDWGAERASLTNDQVLFELQRVRRCTPNAKQHVVKRGGWSSHVTVHSAATQHSDDPVPPCPVSRRLCVGRVLALLHMLQGRGPSRGNGAPLACGRPNSRVARKP